MAKRVDFHCKDSNLKIPYINGYKIKNGLAYGYLQKTEGEKEFNDLVCIIPMDELKGIIISDIKKDTKDEK